MLGRYCGLGESDESGAFDALLVSDPNLKYDPNTNTYAGVIDAAGAGQLRLEIKSSETPKGSNPNQKMLVTDTAEAQEELRNAINALIQEGMSEKDALKELDLRIDEKTGRIIPRGQGRFKVDGKTVAAAAGAGFLAYLLL